MLGAFFRNLLKDHPGDVERAIRQTRSDLFNTGRYPPSWSSAVVFAKGAPPTFEFLKDKPAPFSVEKQAQFDVLRQFRQSMAKLFLEAVADRSPFLAALAFAGDQDKALLKKDAMVRPRFVKSASGSTDIVIELVGSITARRLTGNVAIGGDNATIDQLVPDPRLETDGFLFLSGVNAGGARFSIESPAAGGARLRAGPLFTAKATIGGAAPAVHEVVVTQATSDPKAIVWSGMDVLAVVS
jgi:hypothetical protein